MRPLFHTSTMRPRSSRLISLRKEAAFRLSFDKLTSVDFLLIRETTMINNIVITDPELSYSVTDRFDY